MIHLLRPSLRVMVIDIFFFEVLRVPGGAIRRMIYTANEDQWIAAPNPHYNLGRKDANSNGARYSQRCENNQQSRKVR